jgi:hypothetical protein
MRGDSDFIGPALHLVLEHLRDTGRDQEADPIWERLHRHEKSLERAEVERTRVKRSDTFMPHQLKASQIDRVRRLLYQHPRVQAAWLARKQLKLFDDKLSYVLCLKRRSRLFDEGYSDRKFVQFLRPQLEIPCAIVLLHRLSRRARRSLLEACPEPVFVAPD